MTDYLEYGPYAFLFWDDVGRMAWQDRSKLDIELERKSIEYGRSAQYRELKIRREKTNG